MLTKTVETTTATPETTAATTNKKLLQQLTKLQQQLLVKLKQLTNTNKSLLNKNGKSMEHIQLKLEILYTVSQYHGMDVMTLNKLMVPQEITLLQNNIKSCTIIQNYIKGSLRRVNASGFLLRRRENIKLLLMTSFSGKTHFKIPCQRNWFSLSRYWCDVSCYNIGIFKK